MNARRCVVLTGLILSMSVVGAAWAMCAYWYVWIHPMPSEGLSPMSRIIVFGSLGAEKVVEKIAEQRPLLRSPDEDVPLEVVEVNRGEYSESQAVLKPVRPLKVGKKYRLVVGGGLRSDHHPGGPDPTPFTPATHDQSGMKPAEWVVAPAPAPKAWQAAPELGKSEFHEFGCGPSSHQEIKLALTGARTRTLLRISVAAVPATADLAAKPVVTVRPIEGSVALIGHGMCTGAHGMTPGQAYHAKFWIVQPDGTETAAPGDGLHFRAPGGERQRSGAR